MPVLCMQHGAFPNHYKHTRIIAARLCVAGALQAMSFNDSPNYAKVAHCEPAVEGHISDFEHIRTHCFSDLASTPEEIRNVIMKLGQRQLQDRFRKVYQRATWSNNNTWLRRRLLEATGFQAPKQAARSRSTGSRSHGVGVGHKPRQRLTVRAADTIDTNGNSGVRRTARPPKPKVMSDDVVICKSGARYGTGNRPASAPRTGSRTAIRSAPRPIPTASQHVLHDDSPHGSYQSLTPQSLGVPPLSQHSGFSDGEYTEYDDMDDESMLVSTNSAFDGVDSPTFGRHGGESDRAMGSEVRDGSQPASLVSTEGSFDFTAYHRLSGGGMHFDQQLVKARSRGLGSTSLSSGGAGSLSPLSARQARMFSPGTASVPLHTPLNWRASSAPSGTACTPLAPSHHSVRGEEGWSQGPRSGGGHNHHLSITASRPAGDLGEDLWRVMAAEDATHLGLGLGNIRISESPRLTSRGRSISSALESSSWAATPGSASGKRKTAELSSEYGSAEGGDGVGTPLRKLRAETPQQRHDSIVGFGRADGSAMVSGAGSGDDTLHPHPQGVPPTQLLPTRPASRGRSAPLLLEAPLAGAERPAALQWKINFLDEMLECVTAAEQRMLNISNMRVV